MPTAYIKRLVLNILGWSSIALGVIGIFLPLLPTTPFILLAAWCFARSSDRFHHWLITHPRLGPIISTWQREQSIPRELRNRVLIVLWLSLTASALIIHSVWAAVGLGTLGIIGSVVLCRRTLSG